VPEGVEVCRWVLGTARGATAFYDIDTPVTMAAIERGECEYLTPDLIADFDLYLSFTGGPTLDRLRQRWGARRPVAFWCMVDPDLYSPIHCERRWDLGYLGTYSPDRQPAVDELLLDVARALPDRRFVIGGAQFPGVKDWPDNVEYFEHVPPARHAEFYGRQRFTLNVTRADMVAAGWSPSVRLFEAAACGVPVISDRWPGIEDVFTPDREIVLADSSADVLRWVLGDTDRWHSIARAARRRVLRSHTGACRAEQLECELEAVLARRMGARG
jgi:spore maturation protein CgeB